MKKTFISILALSTLLIITVLVIAQNKTHSLSQTVLKDKIKGGWAGQMIGVSFGAPTEFQSNGKIIEGQLKWTPDRVSNAIDQDDLYVEMTFTKVLDELGMNATCEQFGEGDFDKTLEIATRAGQDSDCNPSSAAGVLGVMMGYDKIPDQWKSGIGLRPEAWQAYAAHRDAR